MFSLIAMGTGVAGGYSVVATLVPSAFPQAFRAADGSVAVYFEAAAVITVLVLLGQVLELRARERTSGAIKALLNLAPKTARRIGADGNDEEMSLDRVTRSEEHTSELQSLMRISYAVFCLKKKTTTKTNDQITAQTIKLHNRITNIPAK